MRKKIFMAAGLVAILALERPAYAVVGQAEEYNKFSEADLESFHQELVNEEQLRKQQEADEMIKVLKDRKKAVKKSQGAQKQEINEQVVTLEKELLQLPKRDRFRTEHGGQYQFDTNINRNIINSEKNDSIVDVNSTALFDLSGRKTDLRFEVSGARQWNREFPKKDFWSAEERIRYRRKYFKKLTHSLQSRIARTSSKTVEMDSKKIRWDSFQNTAMNYAFSRKLSLNVEGNHNYRYFIGEPFDQDSAWEGTFAPSGFWNFTPKSRISAGYTFGANRIRTEASDANTHEVHIGYFGKVTRKTSMSTDISFSHQTPRATTAPSVNTLTVGKGLIWQMTPKTQMTLQFLRSVQNTTSNSVVGSPDANATSKTDNHFSNESLTFSLNYRLNQRVTVVVTSNISHVRTFVAAGAAADPDTETQQIMFPNSINVTYFMKRWLRLQLGYTFTYRTGYEHADNFRSHNITTSVHAVV